MDKLNNSVLPAIIMSKSNFFNFGRPVVDFLNNDNGIVVGPPVALIMEPENNKNSDIAASYNNIIEQLEKACL